MFKRVGFVVGAAVATIALSASSAFAFECYNASRSAQGNQAAAGSNGFFNFETALIEFDGLCPAGAQVVIDGLEDAGFRTDLLINAHTLMAGGLEKNGKGENQLHDGKGIDHLTGEFFATVESLIPAGQEACEA
jgi:hypothetical protein